MVSLAVFEAGQTGGWEAWEEGKACRVGLWRG